MQVTLELKFSGDSSTNKGQRLEILANIAEALLRQHDNSGITPSDMDQSVESIRVWSDSGEVVKLDLKAPTLETI